MKELSKFYLVLQEIDRNKYKKIFRRGDRRIDISQMKRSGLYHVWSSERIAKLPEPTMSKNKNEPRPYIYEVDKQELLSLFPDLPLNIFDGNSYTEKEKNDIEAKLVQYM